MVSKKEFRSELDELFLVEFVECTKTPVKARRNSWIFTMLCKTREIDTTHFNAMDCTTLINPRWIFHVEAIEAILFKI